MIEIDDLNLFELKICNLALTFETKAVTHLNINLARLMATSLIDSCQ